MKNIQRKMNAIVEEIKKGNGQWIQISAVEIADILKCAPSHALSVINELKDNFQDYYNIEIKKKNENYKSSAFIYRYKVENEKHDKIDDNNKIINLLIKNMTDFKSFFDENINGLKLKNTNTNLEEENKKLKDKICELVSLNEKLKKEAELKDNTINGLENKQKADKKNIETIINNIDNITTVTLMKVQTLLSKYVEEKAWNKTKDYNTVFKINIENAFKSIIYELKHEFKQYNDNYEE